MLKKLFNREGKNKHDTMQAKQKKGILSKCALLGTGALLVGLLSFTDVPEAQANNYSQAGGSQAGNPAGSSSSSNDARWRGWYASGNRSGYRIMSDSTPNSPLTIPSSSWWNIYREGHTRVNPNWSICTSTQDGAWVATLHKNANVGAWGTIPMGGWIDNFQSGGSGSPMYGRPSNISNSDWNGYLSWPGNQWYTNSDVSIICALPGEETTTETFWQYRYSSDFDSDTRSRTFRDVARLETSVTPTMDPSGELRAHAQTFSGRTPFGRIYDEIRNGEHDNKDYDELVDLIRDAMGGSNWSVVGDLKAETIAILSSSGKGGVLDWISRESEAVLSISETTETTTHEYERRQWTCEFTRDSGSNSRSDWTSNNGRSITAFDNIASTSRDRVLNNNSNNGQSSHTNAFNNADCSSGSWNDYRSNTDTVVNEPEVDSNLRSMQFKSYWQSIGAVCNAEGMRAATDAVTGSNVFNNNANGMTVTYGSGATAPAARDENLFVYAQSPRNTRGIEPRWGNSNHSNSAIAATGSNDFFQQECVGVPHISQEGPDNSNVSGSARGQHGPHNPADLVCRPDDYVHIAGNNGHYSNFNDGVSNPRDAEDFDSAFGPGLGSVLSYVNDNEANTISLQPAVVDPDRSGALWNVNGSPNRTTVERWSEGTPGVDGNGVFALVQNNSALFQNGVRSMTDTVSFINGGVNRWDIYGDWASESDKPETLAFSWTYDARQDVYMPVRHWPNFQQTWDRSNGDARTRGNHTYNTGRLVRYDDNGNISARYANDGDIQIRCYTTFTDGDNYSGDYDINAVNDGGSIQDYLSADPEAPWNLQVNFTRQVSER